MLSTFSSGVWTQVRFSSKLLAAAGTLPNCRPLRTIDPPPKARIVRRIEGKNARSLEESSDEAPTLGLVKSVSDIAVSQDVGWICGVISELFPYLSDNHTQMSTIGYITPKVKGGM